MKKIFKQISILAALTIMLQMVFPLYSSASETDTEEYVSQDDSINNDFQLNLDNQEFMLKDEESKLEEINADEENEVQTYIIHQIFIRQYVKNAIKDKMGDKIEQRIGKEVADRVIPEMQDEAEKLVKKHGISDFVGPKNSNGTIKQGEHIFSIYDKNGSEIMRGHVNINSPNRTTSTWHWHKSDDNFKYHHGQIQINHNSLPSWGD